MSRRHGPAQTPSSPCSTPSSARPSTRRHREGTTTAGAGAAKPPSTQAQHGRAIQVSPTSPPGSAARRASPSTAPPGSADAKPVAESAKIARLPPAEEIELRRARVRARGPQEGQGPALAVVGEKDRLVGELNEASSSTRYTKLERAHGQEVGRGGHRDRSSSRRAPAGASTSHEEGRGVAEEVEACEATPWIWTLVTTTEELERFSVSFRWPMRPRRLRSPHDAMKIAEVNADKVEILSGEVIRLKGLLDSSCQAEESKTVKPRHLLRIWNPRFQFSKAN
ncbi:hypothetical protein ZWY2020_003838 [Hordeum vulgare]|nr:hypothetical protein ZWY2020_003838 [Hordeum vulgare]